MTWQIALRRLIGRKDWWWFDVNCRDGAPGRDACRELAIGEATKRAPIAQLTPTPDEAPSVKFGCCGQIFPA